MRYFLEFSYHGQPYHGWQKQPNAITVQEVMEQKMSTKLRSSIQLVAAGRTDAGVHAQQMFAHFDYPKPIQPSVILDLNKFLPHTIAIQKVHAVQPNAHARFDALSRSYEYHISLKKNPFSTNLSWQRINGKLDLIAMQEASQLLFNYQDFTSFARLHSDAKTNICQIQRVNWNITDYTIVFKISADRFLRNMVRAIVGTLVEIGLKKIPVTQFAEIIEKKDRSFAGGSAPAQGLFLSKVSYPKEIFLNE